jgi:tetratricopeptide (TPR) repeat protein
LALHQQGRLDEAEKLYDRALKLDRNNFDALHMLGLLNQQRGRPAEAHKLIAQALKVHSRSPDALANHALVLHTLKRSPEALASLDKALAIDPQHEPALNSRGNILVDLGRPADAVAAFDAILSRQPRSVPALINRGNALAALGEFDRALADHDAAQALASGHPQVLYNRANTLHALGREEEAVAGYGAVLAAIPNHINAWQNRGLALAALNRHREALDCYRRLLTVQPDHVDAHFNASMSLLTLGDYRNGFAEYEWRWKRGGMVPRKDLRAAPWLGETPLAGKSILLHAEQGLGDTIMFARYVLQLARDGARVVLEVQPELKALLGSLEGASAVVGRGEKLPPVDLHCPLGSLPLACKTEPGSIPASIPYLRAETQRVARWRARLDGVRTPRVALVWSGRPTHINDRRRSIALAHLEPLLSLSGVQFISLQRDLREADAALLASDSRLLALGDELADLGDTAAVLTLCDLLISVDTSVAHLAGALARPAFVLIPFQPDWRWQLDTERSDWYPALRLFRQPAIGDWTSVIERVRAELARTFAL